MDKLKLAHEYFMKHGRNNSWMSDDVAEAWKYADAMQAEAKKREQEASEKASKEIKDILENHEHVFVDGRICWCGKIKSDIEEEWQPDWSQAPKSMNYFFMNKDGSKYWTVNKPDKPNLSEHVMDCLECGGDCYAYASSQDYQGNWQDSLRKRP